MQHVNCPRCGNRGQRIVWGMPTHDTHEAVEADPDLVLGGCCVEPTVTHQCATCGNRWWADWPKLFGDEPPAGTGGSSSEGDGDLWVVGDLHGHRVLSAEEWPEDDSIVWLESDPANPMTLDEFDLAHGEGVVGWLAETEPYVAGDVAAIDADTDAPSEEPSVWWVGELAGQRILSRVELPNPDDEVWLEFDPGGVLTLEDFDAIHAERDVTWLGEPEPYEMRIPDLVSADRAAEVLGCDSAELDDWRRSVLPAAPRRFYGQRDDEFRTEEVLAVAVGRWLRRWNTRAGDGFAARLALTPPVGQDWCVVRRSSRNMEITYGPSTIQVKGDTRTAVSSFDPRPVLDAIGDR